VKRIDTSKMSLQESEAIYRMQYRDYLIYSDDFARVCVKDSPQEDLTKKIFDCGNSRDFNVKFGNRETGKFEINNDPNATAIVYLDTLEKVHLKNRPKDIITNYLPVSTFSKKISLGNPELR
jgi:hypothetical protein